MTKPGSHLPAEIKDYSVTGETFSIIECKNCQLLHTEVPESKEMATYYVSSDYVSHRLKYLNPVHLLYAMARRFTLQSKRKLVSKLSQGGSILDYGCGTGEFLEVMNKSGWSTSGYEPSEQAIRRAASKGLENLTREQEQIKTGQHIITLWHVLEHTDNPVETIRSLKEKLTKSGKLLVAIPNYKSHDANLYGEHWAGYDVPRHLWHLSSVSMSNLGTKTGLRIIEKIPMKLDAFYVSLLSEKYLNQNRQGILTYFKALAKGYISNNRASATGEYSSMIYILSE
jgi:2-polyprenyl-3-methyl-5-hydroxy-6-metoxy-1,4-benzoquinol methylase